MPQTNLATCTVTHCINPIRDNHLICDQCWTTFITDINWLSNHVTDLEYRLNKAYGKTGQGGGRVLSASPDPMRQPIHTLLYETDDHGNDGLETLLHVYLQSTGIGYRWNDGLKTMLQRVRGHLSRVRDHKATPAYIPQFHTAANRARRLLDSPEEEQILLGDCPTPQCGHRLSAGVNDKEARCAYCRNIWTVNYLRRRQHERLLSDDTVATQSQLLDLLSLQGVIVKGGTLRKWIHEGDIQPVRVEHGHKLYRLGDVYGRSARMDSNVLDMPKVQGK